MINAIFKIIFCLIFWILFYSSILSNYPRIIDIRNSYFEILDSYTPKDLFIYKIRPIKVISDESFVYNFPDKFQEFDFKNSIIVMKDLYGRTWKFKYIPNERTENFDKLMFNEMVIAKDKSSVTVKESLKRFPKPIAALGHVAYFVCRITPSAS